MWGRRWEDPPRQTKMLSNVDKFDGNREKFGYFRDQVMDALVSLRGIGPWTAQVYLLMALCRPDVWPAGDLALQRAVQGLRGLEALPDFDAMNGIAESWRPWRAVAARMLWHADLCERDAAD